MSQTRNQTTTVGPDAAGAAYLGQARDAAQRAYQNTIAQPYFDGDRSAGVDPLQQQGAAYAGQMASLFGPAAQNLMAQSGSYAPANDYFNAQMTAGRYGYGQQYGVAGGTSGAQAALQGGVNAGLAGQNTLNAANGLFGQGVQGQQLQAQQLNPYLQASQGLLNTNAIGSLDARAMAGDAAQNQIGALGQNAAQTGYGAVTGALSGQPDTAAFMNPYQDQVLGAVRDQFAQTRDLTNRNISDRATAAGAFGGSREAVTRGAALADVARNETAQLAGLTKQGYDDAISRAMAQQQFRAGAGQSLFGQGLGALGQQAGSGDAATAQRLALYGQGLNNLGSAGMQGSNALFNTGYGAGQSLFGAGQQNANTLFGAGNQAAQFLGTQGSYGANQAGQFGADANRALFGAGVQGADQLGQYGTLFQNLAQQGIDRNIAGMEDPIRRQQQALGMFGMAGIPQGGQSSTTPVTRNYLTEGLGYAGVVGGLLGGPLGGVIGSGIGGLFGGGGQGGGITNDPFSFGGRYG